MAIILTIILFKTEILILRKERYFITYVIKLQEIFIVNLLLHFMFNLGYVWILYFSIGKCEIYGYICFFSFFIY